MDLLTQGLLGGALASSLADEKQTRLAAAVGFAAALLADADVLIQAGDDSLLQLEYHRHFTHALVFIPVGALIAALLCWPLLRKRLDFGSIYRHAFCGYATAGLLDACTSYGTSLLWPFSETRIAWSLVAIVDPLFSLLLLAGLWVALRRRRPGPVRFALALAGGYLLIGLWQHHAALQSARELAASRGHEPERILVKPTLANLLLWRSVYLSGDTFHVDGIRVGPGGDRVYPGGSAPRFDPGRDRPDLRPGSLARRDIERFARLSDGFVAPDPLRDNVLIDIRYSMLPTTTTPMWGLDLGAATHEEHARFRVYRDRPDGFRQAFVAMLLGRDPP